MGHRKPSTNWYPLCRIPPQDLSHQPPSPTSPPPPPPPPPSSPPPPPLKTYRDICGIGFTRKNVTQPNRLRGFVTALKTKIESSINQLWFYWFLQDFHIWSFCPLTGRYIILMSQSPSVAPGQNNMFTHMLTWTSNQPRETQWRRTVFWSLIR